jgi:hypothetical protein
MYLIWEYGPVFHHFKPISLISHHQFGRYLFQKANPRE